MKLNKTLQLFTTVLMIVTLFGCNQPVVAEEPTPIVEEPVIEEPIMEEPIVEEPEPEPEPEEFNPRNMKQVYNLDFDVPIYTEEEVEEAKNKLLNDYTESDWYFNPNNFQYSERVKKFEKKGEIAKYFYIANQEAIYELYDMFKDFDIVECRKTYVNKPSDHEADFYDEQNEFIITMYEDHVNNSQSFSIHGKGFTLDIYLNSELKGDIGTLHLDFYDKPLGDIIVGPGLYIYPETLESFDEWYDLYFNSDYQDRVKDFNELAQFNYPSKKFEKTIIPLSFKPSEE